MQTPAALAGLKAGDTIVSIDGKSFSSPTTMTNIIKRSHRHAAASRRSSATAS